MSNSIFGAIDTIGSAQGALDTVVQATLSDGDIAIVADDTEEALIYRYESSSTDTESDPEVVMPDAAGTGRWILTDLSMQDLKTYGNAVFDGTITATGLLTATAGIDIDGTLQFDGAGPAITVIRDEDNMASHATGDVALATQQSIYEYIQSVTAGVTVDMMAGYTVPTKFTYSATDAIVLAPARYHLEGATEQIVKWDANITYSFIALGTDDWSYLYIDDSAVQTEGTNIISNTELIDNVSEPSWSATKLGYYNGADRCIGAFKTNGADELLLFYNPRPGYIELATAITLTSGPAAITLDAPSFASSAMIQCNTGRVSGWVHYEAADSGIEKDMYYSYEDDSGDNQGRTYNAMVWEVSVDASQQFTLAGPATTVTEWGYFLPKGII